MAISKFFIGVLLLFGLFFTACSSGSSDNANISATITAVDGYIKNATITDMAGQVGAYTSNGKYTFANAIAYPLTLTGGQLEDTDAPFDIDMTAQEGALVISPITTFLENDSVLLDKLANLGFQASTLDEFAVDYVYTNNQNLAKLAQLLYATQKNSTLLNAFKARLRVSNPSSLNEMFTLLELDVNAVMSVGFAQSYKSFLNKVQDLDVMVYSYETELKNYKTNLNLSTVVHNNISYGEIVSPYTQKIWLDRNLGASVACTALNDIDCYGDYYQWGRGFDGHEKSNSNAIKTQAQNIESAGADFIMESSDWLVTNIDDNGNIRTLNWSKTDGTSVCPVGYRVPTLSELLDETYSASTVVGNNINAFNNFLKLPSAGYRSYIDALMRGRASEAVVWSSSVGGSTSGSLSFKPNKVDVFYNHRAFGFPVRCIND